MSGSRNTESRKEFLYGKNTEEDKQLAEAVSRKKQSQLTTTGSIIPSQEISFQDNMRTAIESESKFTPPLIVYPWKKPMFQYRAAYHKLFEYLHHAADRIVVFKCTAPVYQITEQHKICNQTFTVAVGSYYNLDRHLKSKIHQISLDEIKVSSDSQKKNLVLPPATPGASSIRLKRSHPEQMRFDRDILRLYADGLPFNFIERKSFTNMVQNLDSRITVKRRTAYVTKLRTEVEQKIKPELKSLMRNAGKQSIHFSVDIWTNRRQVSTLGMKIHHITPKWNHSIRTIALVEFSGAHTGTRVKEAFKNVIQSYGAEDFQVGVVVTDNASNMKKAFNLEGILDSIQSAVEQLEEDVTDELKEGSQQSQHELDFQEELGDSDNDISEINEDSESSHPIQYVDFSQGLGWSPCLAHTVQLAINDAIKIQESVTTLIREVNDIINFFRRSPKWLAVYRKEVLEACECPNKVPHELLQPNITRWNSTFSAIERIANEEVFQAIQSVLSQVSSLFKSNKAASKKFHPIPKRDQLLELCGILKPVKLLTDGLQSDHLTCNTVIVSIVTAYRDVLKAETKWFGLFKQDLLDNMKNRLEGTLSNKWFVCGAALDPRQKLMLFSGLKWSDEDNQLTLPKPEWVQLALKKELEIDRIITNFDIDEDSNCDTSLPKRLKKAEGIFAVLNEIEQPAALAPLTISKDVEQLQKYLSEPPEDVLPLRFWNDKMNSYPAVAKLARRILPIPASSGSVERLFSAAGAIGRARRSKTDITKVEQLLLYRESAMHIA